jgi:Fur family transcriptional regulator, ferric uptake regulator
MTSSEILKQNAIIQSPLRLEVLEVLIASSKPLSQREIEQKIDKSHDRVTMYRTLKLFVEKQLIHRIAVSDNLVTFGLKTENSDSGADHLHFHCNDCDNVFCMPQVPVQKIELPKGFVGANTNLIVNGICEKCNKEIKK